MILRRLLIGSVSLSALAILATPALAQDQPAPAEQAGDDEESIIVTGIRGSLRASIDAKRESDVVADFLTAEDIGQFPDRNVAEALQRVPGIVINREFGEGERVSLRGTAPNLTRTLVDGHAIATADWFVLEQLAATRSFNYLTLPSEIVSRLDVYKSPQADIDEGGVGGTINVRTRTPLALDTFTASGSAEMVYSELRDSLDPQASALLSWHNDAGTFGILIAGVYQRRDIRRDGVEVLGYFNPVDNPATPANEDPSGDALIPSLIGSALFVQERERYGGNIALQFRPSDELEVTLTGLYSRFGADNYNQNYLAWGTQAIGGGGTLTDFTVTNGTVVSGRIDSTPGGRAVVFDAIDRQAFAETWAANLDLTWHPSDRGTFHLMGGYTEAHGDTTSQPFFEGGAPGGFTFDLTGRAPEVSFIGIDPTDPNDLVFDFGSLHEITNTDREFYFFADYEHEVELGPINALRFGAKYTDHDRITVFNATTFGGFFLPLLASGCGGGPCTPGDFFAGNLTPGNFLENVAEPGTLTSYWQVDRDLLEQIYFGLPASVRARVINPPENYSITERTYGGYVMARFGGDNWRGNAGLRIVVTDQTSRGNEIGLPPGTPGAIETNPFGIFRPITVERSYTDILPSINLAFDLTSELVLRMAAARVMARPDYTDIVPRVNLNPGSLTAAGGDPSVDPFRANQFDVSLEWYPDRETIVAGALFYKDINSYITDTITQERFPVQTNTPNLARCTPLGPPGLFDCLFDVNRRANGTGGRNIGFEIQAQREIWNGFGAVANYTYSDANSESGDEIPGNSRHTLNLSGYYENDWVSARLSYNYRSSFFITFDRATPLNQAATDSLDASLNVRITDNISLTADAINLTNEKIVQFSSIRDRPRAIYDNGRQFYFGVRVRY